MTPQEALIAAADARPIGHVVGTERTAMVHVGGGAWMDFPLPGWVWSLCYVRPEPDRGTLCDDRLLAAGMIESYLYLVQECTKEEAWRRIKIIRKAIADSRRAGERENG